MAGRKPASELIAILRWAMGSRVMGHLKGLYVWQRDPTIAHVAGLVAQSTQVQFKVTVTQSTRVELHDVAVA